MLEYLIRFLKTYFEVEEEEHVLDLMEEFVNKFNNVYEREYILRKLMEKFDDIFGNNNDDDDDEEYLSDFMHGYLQIVNNEDDEEYLMDVCIRMKRDNDDSDDNDSGYESDY